MHCLGLMDTIRSAACRSLIWMDGGLTRSASFHPLLFMMNPGKWMMSVFSTSTKSPRAARVV